MNRMCKDCACRGKDCDGTDCETWTNCIYRRAATKENSSYIPIMPGEKVEENRTANKNKYEERAIKEGV